MASFQKSALAAMFVELGEAGAAGWTANRLTLKMKGLPKTLNEDAKLSKSAQKTLDSVLKAVKAGDDLEVVDDAAAAPKAGKKGAKAEAPAPKAGKKKAKAPEPEEDEEEESEEEEPGDEDEDSEEEPEGDEDEDSEEDDEDMAEAEKAFKDPDAEEDEEEEDDDEAEEDATSKKKAPKGDKKKPKKEKGPKAPGVIDTIVEVLTEAGKNDKPVKKEAIADVLAKRFKDRDRDSMLKTVNVQVPSRLKTDRNLKVERNEHGYFIPPAKSKK